ncbi:hypothetical protein MMPV_004310 [Pyropia vietnamensis]
MCGIFGYVNCGVGQSRRTILDILLNGLRRLEYRGYDSAGLVCDGAGGASMPVVIKQSGTVEKLAAAVGEAVAHDPRLGSGVVDVALDSHVGIAHTRWATHGAPSSANSHPHSSDPTAQFLVVHNGIVTNYKALKAMLLGKGYTFETETDTEVVARLLKFLYETVREDGQPLSFAHIVMHMMHALDGAYALLVRSTLFPGEVVACKRGSPLVLGLKGDVRELPSNGSVEVLRGSLPGQVAGGGDGGSGGGGGCGVGGGHALASSPAKRRRLASGEMGSPMAPVSTVVAVAAAGATNGCSGGNARLSPSIASSGSPAHHCEYFFSSDAAALVEHTDQVVYVEDNDVVHVDAAGGLHLYSFGAAADAVVTNRVIQTLEMELQQIMKGSYDTFMRKEIFEQPESLTQTLRGRLVKKTTDLPTAAGAGTGYSSVFRLGDLDVDDRIPLEVQLGGLNERLADIRRSNRVIFVACGTSYNSCLAARQTMEELAELPVSVELASDFLDRRCPIYRSDACVFVSQSGETAETLEALRYARSHHALTVGIVNCVGSSISRLTDCGVHLNAGGEVGVASTKVYTSQIVVLIMIALLLSSDSRGKDARRAEVLRGLAQLPSRVETTLTAVDGMMKAIAQQLKDAQSILLFGRGYQYATCLEAALKIKEVSYVHTEGIHAGELKHGPLALVDDKMPVVLFASCDATATKVHNALAQVAARGGLGRMIIVGCVGDAEVMRYKDSATLVLVPRVVDCLQCVLNIVPMQLLSYHLAVARGLNVDQPRNLAKAVTVQ